MGDDTPQLSLYVEDAQAVDNRCCRHQVAGPKRRWPDRRRGLSESPWELEAQATAGLVCRRASITTRSATYLRGRMSEEQLRDELGGISVFAILGAAHRIEARGEGRRQ